MTQMSQTLFVAEPPAVYLARPALVVDCSVLAAVLFEEPSRDEAAHLMQGWHRAVDAAMYWARGEQSVRRERAPG